MCVLFCLFTEGVLLISISACGFIGNSLSVIVLLRSSLKGNFSYQLTSLAGERTSLLYVQKNWLSKKLFRGVKKAIVQMLDSFYRAKLNLKMKLNGHVKELLKF